MLPVIFIVYLQTHGFCSSTSSKRTATLPDKPACNVYNNVIRCEAPPPNLKTAKISSYTVCSYVEISNPASVLPPILLPVPPTLSPLPFSKFSQMWWHKRWRSARHTRSKLMFHTSSNASWVPSPSRSCSLGIRMKPERTGEGEDARTSHSRWDRGRGSAEEEEGLGSDTTQLYPLESVVHVCFG